jgi:hypothetical protein
VYLLVDMLQLLKDLRVYILPVCHNQLIEMEANSINDLALVDDRIEWVPHLV